MCGYRIYRYNSCSCYLPIIQTKPHQPTSQNAPPPSTSFHPQRHPRSFWENKILQTWKRKDETFLSLFKTSPHYLVNSSSSSSTMKKGKSFLMEAAYPYCPSSSSRPGQGEEAKAWSRHHSLMEDYMDLEREVEVKRRKLLKANKKKLKLLDMVKFLRSKFKSFSKNPSRRIQSRVKKHSPKLLPQPSVQRKGQLKDSQEVCEPTISSIAMLFDLNQIIPVHPYNPSCRIKHAYDWSQDVMNEFQVEPESPRTDFSRGIVVTNERKISCQNQRALRV